MTLLNQIREPSFKLSKSAKKVAEVILQNPDEVIHSSVAKLAVLSKVSEPSVIRFCHKFGCTGFPDFKVQLAQSLATAMPQITRDVDENDSLETMIEKIFDSTHATLQLTQAASDLPSIEKATDALAQANSILFFGLGASGPVALDAQHKFFRINTPVIAHLDILNQRMTSANLTSRDVVVCISYTGRTIALIETARIAKKCGAEVIGITSPNSPLAKECSIVLEVETPEDTDMYTPMTSRIAHLVLIDVLVTAVALKRGPQFSEHLLRIKESFAETRINKAEF
ncbi:MAG: transcriptional regulator HexR [Gammaproteobacteria bacterium]|nr:MAG: transcriptional regulator HexR [Gammaproteobacteria bacterium]PCJ46892.1 MAG: transcriptional regulator HexR [Gammaproteobacteria bacterium]